MNSRNLVLLVVSATVLGASLVFASHVATPPVSNGGELAYVRNYPSDALDLADAGQPVSATYVGWTADEDGSQKDVLEHFTSRGRAADTQVLHKVDLPEKALRTDRAFVPVDQYERGLVLFCSDAGRLALLNGVNAGLSVQADEPFEARLQTSGRFDVEQISDTRVNLSQDGHVYALEATGNGSSLSVEGVNIRASLQSGGEVRGWIDREFPATTQVMNSVFDHIASGQLSCAAPPPTPSPSPSPTETPTPSPTETPSPTPSPASEPADVSITKTAEQNGDTVVFTMTVHNAGPGTAVGDGVYLNDTLPDVQSQWFIGGPDSEACALENNSFLQCVWEEIPANESRSVTATGYTQNVCEGTEIPNTATVSAENDSTADNNEASASGQGTKPCADVGVQKTVEQDASNDTAVFTIVVSSTGSSDAAQVNLSDALPDVGSSWFLGGPDSEACTLENNSQLTCTWDTIPTGESRTVTATAYTSNVCNDQTIANTATVSADVDTNADNNQSSATAMGTNVCADVSVAMETVQDSQAVVFKITLTSLGPDTALHATLADDLPDMGGRAWLLGGADSEACTVDGNALRCDFGDLAANAVRKVEVKAYTDQMGCGDDLANTATAAADNDGNSDNNAASGSIDRPDCTQ